MMSQNIPLFLYRAKVEALAKEQQGKPLYNDSIEHAAIILQSMVSYAQRSVKLLTGELNVDAYGRRAILDEIKHFVEDESHSLQILYENEALRQRDAGEEHPFFRVVTGKGGVELRHVPPRLQSRYDFHFIVVDGRSYRFEPNKKKFEAVAAFGDEEGGKKLEGLFSVLWNSAGEVNAPSETIDDPS